MKSNKDAQQIMKSEIDSFQLANDNRKPGKILAIIPCYNEEATIGSVVLRTKRYVDEVLVINDGSIDDTSQIAREAGAKVISNKINQGKSYVIKTGFKYAIDNNFDYIVTLDGDMQHNPNEIPNILDPLYFSNVDISLGARWGDSTEMPKWRKIGKRVLDYVTSAGNGGFVTDSQCGFRAFTQKALQELLPRLNTDSFSIESEQLIRAHELGLEIKHTKISCRYKNLDSSTLGPSKHGLSVLNNIIRLVAEKRPLLFIATPGLILLSIGFFWGILTLQYYNQTGVFLISYAILTAILMIIGAIAMFIGLVLNTLPNIIKKTIQKQNEIQYRYKN